MTAIEKLETQQKKVMERSAPWMVAEQLKDICRNEPVSAALIEKDLDNKGMGIVEAEKQIKASADRHRAGGFSCVTPIEAEKILREFYGLPERGAEPKAETSGVSFDLSALMEGMT